MLLLFSSWTALASTRVWEREVRMPRAVLPTIVECPPVSLSVLYHFSNLLSDTIDLR